MYYDIVLKDIVAKQEIKQSGGFNGIPLPFIRYRDYVSSIEKSQYYGILGGPGKKEK